MPEFMEIVRELPPEKFAEIFGASARAARETYFFRHGVKTPKKRSGMPKPGQKNALRTAALFELLKTREDEEMVEEVLRTWLLTKRHLLSRALDYMGIDHDNGLTESEDVSRFEDLKGDKLKALVKDLTEVAGTDDIGVYLKFMGVEGADEVLGAAS